MCMGFVEEKYRSQSPSFWKPRRARGWFKDFTTQHHIPSAIEKEGTTGMIKAFSQSDLRLKWNLLDKATTRVASSEDFRSKIFSYIGVQFFRYESK